MYLTLPLNGIMVNEAQPKLRLQSKEWLRNLEIDRLDWDLYLPLFHCLALVKLLMFSVI